MTWETAITALGAVFILAALISLLGYSSEQPDRESGVLEAYLLAGGALGRVSVVNLLLSTSFGINTMLYQGYLGATVGVWGLVVQAAWAGGFLLLSRWASSVRSYKGLHDFLGVQFGAATRLVAALFSLVGITVFLGWETSIGRDALKGMLDLGEAQPADATARGAEWLVVGTVVGCLLYTMLGGLRGNAVANSLQNLLKLAGFGSVTVGLGHAYFSRPGSDFLGAMFPPLSAMEASLGWWALVTSIAFGLAWQFVDMSTWQSLAASANSREQDVRWNLTWSGYLVFLTPGVLGTLFGVFLSGQPGASSNVLVAASAAVSTYPGVVVFLFAAAVMAAVMSLIDGLFLASTYTLIVDIFHPNRRIQELDRDERLARKTLRLARLLLLAIAAVSIWGIPWLIKLVGHDKDLFYFSFVVVVAQCAIFGPVLVGLLSMARGTEAPAGRTRHMWVAIVIGGAVGFTCALVGGGRGVKWLTDGAGTFTLATSFVSALVIRRSRPA